MAQPFGSGGKNVKPVTGPVIGMFMESGGMHDNMEQRMTISPKLRDKPLSAQKKRKMFRIRGKTIKQKEKSDENDDA